MPQPSNTKGKKIVERLERLRDEGHLALHMWEDDHGSGLDAFETPRRALACLKFNDDDKVDLDTRLLAQIASNPPKEDLALLSMSLLPRFRNGVATSMIPFDAADFCQGAAGYLMDVTPKMSSPPRLLVAASDDIFTPESPIQKIKSLVPKDLPSCGLFRALPCGRVLQPKDLTDFAIESVSQLQKQIDDELDIDPEYLNVWCNEMVVAAQPKHRTAIVVPIYSSQEGKPRQWMAEAAGAIAGIRHNADKLPVVAYHVDGEKKGGFTYWGQSRAECMSRLLNAVEQLESFGVMDGKDKEDGALDNLRAALSERGVLGYRVDAPKEVRLEQLQALKAGLAGRMAR